MFKLNNGTWKKYEIEFFCKKVMSELVVLHSCKELQVIKKFVYEKKILPAYILDKIFKTVCENLFKINQSWNISIFGN